MLSDLASVQVLFFLLEFVVVSLGLAISYIAFRGYRRHDSRPMLFVSLGFVLLVGVTSLLALVYYATSLLDELALQALNRVSTILGMASILYGLWVDPSD